jgi:hypothetical protein
MRLRIIWAVVAIASVGVASIFDELVRALNIVWGNLA